MTGRDKRQLRARGQTMVEDCQIGRTGLTESFILQLDGLLARKGLVKIRFAEVSGSARKLLADEVCNATSAECITIVGRTMLLFREPIADAPHE